MAKRENQFVQEITPRDVDFAKWYTDIVLKNDMCDYTDVRGCMAIKPYGYAVWELMQKEMDQRFKDTGHQNAYFPLLIPESMLMKEAEHVEGFAPEVAWVTQGGNEVLQERMAIRPTSETIIGTMYSKWIQSYRDLPVLYNQWCNVMRWEKSTRPFLRTSEFLWQEGHTAHETHEDAQEETIRMLNVYYDFMVNVLAIPVVRGRKSESERFAGAEATYTLEALMHDGKALQMGTSHNLSDHFARSYDIKYLSREGKQEYCYTTSWGTSTRMIGGMIMVHGDDRGLKLPPKVAPIQVVILPIAMHKEGVLEKATELYNEIKAVGLRVKLDDSEQSAGWKFNQWEMKGVPARIEIGPRDIENGVVTVVRRDTLEKFTMPIQGIGENLVKLMADIHQTMYDMALEHRKAHTTHAENFGDFMDGVKKGFVKAPWCADPDCEMEIKCVTGASTRCKPMDEDTSVKPGCKCVFCNREAKTMMYFARAY